jgi:outer membrane protein assembly factor BamB/DNA-binding MarR family transcriptional regulator
MCATQADGTRKWGYFDNYWANCGVSPAISTDGTIYYSAGDSYFYAMKPDGKLKWKTQVGYANHASPAIGPDGIIYTLTNKLYALDSNGTIRWNYSYNGESGSSPVLGPDGTIYFISFNGTLYALDHNGTMKWEFPTDGWSFGEPALGPDGTIYFGSDDHKVYALYPNGTEKWEYITGEGVRAAPSVSADGIILIGSDDHYLYAFNPDGTVRWKFFTSQYGSVNYGPTIAQDGTIYFTAACYLWALGSTTPAAPEGLVARDAHSQVELSWNASSTIGVSPVTSYNIYRGTDVGSETFLVKIGNVTHYLDNTVSEGKRYYYTVSASNIEGGGLRSSEVSVKIFFTEASNSAWPMFRGNPQRTGLSCYNTSDNNGQVLWRYPIPEPIIASPIIAMDGTIYIGNRKNSMNSDNGDLYAITHDGTLKWKFNLDEEITESVVLDKNGNLYFGAGDQYLYSLSPNGTLRWRYLLEDFLSSSPVIWNDTIYFGSNFGYVFAMNLNGSFKWKFQTNGSFLSSPALGPDGTVYAASIDGRMYGINPNGTAQWIIPLETYGSTPAVDKDWNIYIASTTNLTKLDRYGRTLWNFSLGKIRSGLSETSPAIGKDGNVYFYSETGQFYAINSNGTLRWNISLQSFYHFPGWSPIVSGDNIIYIKQSGQLTAIGPDGNILWVQGSSSFGNSSMSEEPAIGQDGTIYFISSSGELMAVGNSGSLPQKPKSCPGVTSKPPQNHPPVFVIAPSDMKVQQGKTIRFSVEGMDQDALDDGRLTYSLVSAPKKMSINQKTGDINWRPEKNDTGTHEIVVGVTDGIDITTKSFNITVTPQEPDKDILATTRTPSGILIWSLCGLLVMIGAVLIGGTETGVFGMYSLVLLLYTRLKGEKILDNFLRGQLYGMIIEWPGSSFSELKRKMNKPTGTVAYHLQALEKEQMIKSVSRGTKKLFFPASFIVSDDYFALTDAQRVVYNVVKVNPGISQMGIAKRTGFKPSRINKIIHKLSQKGMLDVVKGKETKCYIQGDQVVIGDNGEPAFD